MKTIYKLFTLICFMAVYQVQAAVITVSNRPGDIAQFDNIVSAIEAAADGDIIYVSGSTISYGSFTLNKRLTLIGTGHNPDNDNSLISQLGTVTLVAVSSGSEIIGFRISQVLYNDSNVEINNINIQRNNIASTISINSNSKEWIIQENIFNSINSVSSNTFEENFIIRNNIIIGTLTNVNHSLITNNVFLDTSILFNVCSFNTLTNNIFFQNNLNDTFANNRIQNSIFNNNISFGPNNPSLPGGNNTGQDNINADPQFVNVTSNSFSYDFDYSLQGSSPGINAGTDDTDIGIFGGAGYSLTGTPAIPEVTELNVLNPIVPQNGNLNLRIRGRANN